MGADINVWLQCFALYVSVMSTMPMTTSGATVIHVHFVCGIFVRNICATIFSARATYSLYKLVQVNYYRIKNFRHLVQNETFLTTRPLQIMAM